MKLSTTYESAKHLHQSNYTDGDFEIAVCKKSGPFDVPPLSWFYGVSDLGSWDCIVSTDGEKVVVTKSAYLDIEEIKMKFEFNKSDITKCSIGTFKNRISFNKKIDGTGEKFNFRIEDELGHEGSLNKKLKLF